ncbi:hypothetical protein RND81_06G175600 [Saponaria officinalis]|uniref:X8 domain-containing protein n=1 Tax=Saponaria officinalis TaxID=3572 RepID=A0AAW1KB58_SAPOF
MAPITIVKLLIFLIFVMVMTVNGVGVNWGTYSSHPLSPEIMLFDVDHSILKDIGRRSSKLEVVVGIPNDMLSTLTSSVEACQKWVTENVTTPMNSYNVNIVLVAGAIIDVGYGNHVKVTIRINADVLSSSNGLPSGTLFVGVGALKFVTPSGFGNLSIVVCEVGWPTDGHIQANLNNSRRFNKGLVNALSKGTPKTPGKIDAFIFSLVDEDQKSLLPGNFERHWGLCTFDGQSKYDLDLGRNKLVQARGVIYEDQKYVNYACSKADCTGNSCANLEPRLKVSYALNEYFQSQDQDEVACDFQGIGIVIKADPSTKTCTFHVNILPAHSCSPSLNCGIINVFFFISCKLNVIYPD